jgi:hypothetical protein
MSEKSRRTLGAAFGAAMGLVYALVAQNINTLVLPGIPVYQPPPGRYTIILLTVVLGGILGLIAAWPEDAIPGVLYSSLAGIGVTSIYTMFLSEGGVEQVFGMLLIFIFTFLPRAVLFVPMAAMTRWAVSVWQAELQTVTFSVRKLALSLGLLLLLAGLVGLFSLYPRQGRDALLTTHALIQQAQKSTSAGGLPEEIKAVDGFSQAGVGSYTLRLSDDPDKLPISRPPTDYNETEYAVLVRFENGYRFACVYVKPGVSPICRAY